MEAINHAQEHRTTARAELDGTPAPGTLTDAEIHAMIDSLGDVGAALNSGKPEKLANLYTAIDLHVRYENKTNTADVSIEPVSRVNSERVRGGT